jgi:hypothetical protein
VAKLLKDAKEKNETALTKAKDILAQPLVCLHGCGVWLPAEKASDPVRALPALLVALA